MFSSVTDLAEQLVTTLGYAGLVLVMAVEHIFPPIPSELVLPLAGFEVARGNLSFVGAVVASTTGSLLGASTLYAIARVGGRPLILRLQRVLRFDEAALDRAERRFERHSTWVVVLGRMVPGVRSVVSVPPGLLRMSFGRYLALSAVGSLAWNVLLIGAGQQLGSRWSEVGDVIEPVAQGVLIVVAPLIVGWLVVRHRRARRTTVPGCDDPAVADLRVRLTPRAHRDAVTGVRDGVVQARVSAPPADGRANASLCRLLADALGVPPSRVTVLRGRSAREKVVRVEGLSADDAHARLAAS